MARLPLLSILFAVVGFISLSLVPDLHSKEIVTHQILAGAVVGTNPTNEAKRRLHLKGAKDYFRFLNETANGISGRKLQLVVLGTEMALNKALQASSDGFQTQSIGFSAFWMADTDEAAPMIRDQKQVPRFEVLKCGRILPPANGYTYIPFGGLDLSCRAILQYIETIHRGSEPPKVGILTANDTCGKYVRNVCEKYGLKHPLQIAATIEFTPGSPNLEPQLLKLRASGAEYGLLQCDAPDALSAFKAADNIRYDIPFFSSWQAMNPDFFKVLKGPIRHRINISFPGCLPGDGSSGIHLVKLLMDRYNSISGFRIDYWEGVAMAAIMARAFQKSNEILGKIDGQTVNLALESFQDEDFGGLVPNITYTDADHGASFVTRIVKANRNQTFTPLTEFWNPKTEKVTIIP